MMSSAPNTLRFAAVPLETSAAARPRIPGLDWLRAAAALAVVALHAGIPYMTHPLPALEWCVRSPERSAVVDALCWAINIAVMPTFFLMGGALAAGLWKRTPPKQFLVHRTRRLILPLVFAFFVVLPADMYVWLIGWYTQGLIPWKKVLSIKLPSPLSEQFWGVAHLWYLECLWTLSVLAALTITLRARFHRSQTPATALPGPRPAAAQLLVLLTAGALLTLDPTFLIGFQQTWWPGPAAIAFYGLFFAAGWQRGATSRPADSPSPRTGVILLSGAPDTLSTPTRSISSSPADRGGRPRLLFAAGLFVFLLPQIHRHVDAPFTGLDLFAFTAAYAACSWLTATGLFALASASKATSVPTPVAFTAEASFWMYLVHHPLVGLTQLALLNTSVPPALKFALSLTIGAGLSLASYAVFVRSTWIGQLLNGRGLSQPRTAEPTTAPSTSEPARRAA